MEHPIYAIGDIHGDLPKLHQVVDDILKDAAQETARPEIVFVGDLVDRRHDSKGVIDFLINGLADGQPWTILKGNHDRMFSMFFDDPHVQDPVLRKDLTWLHPRLGGDTTLQSYGITATENSDPADLHEQALELVPQSHRDLLKSLPTSFETDDVFFAHAGVNPLRALDDQTEDDLCWIRAPFHDHKDPFEKLIIHGHTPVDEVTHYGNRVNIDTGCAYGKDLSVVLVEGTDIAQISAGGRTKITHG